MKINGYFILDGEVKSFHVTDPKRGLDNVLFERARPHGEWEALGFQQGYAFCRCSNCHKTMRLYRDSKNEFCCIADIRKKVVSCMYCGADMSANDKQVTGKLDENTQKHYGFRKKY